MADTQQATHPVDPLTGTPIIPQAERFPAPPPPPEPTAEQQAQRAAAEAEAAERAAAAAEAAEVGRLVALSVQATEVYRTFVEVADAALQRAGEDLEADLAQDKFTVANAALAIWLANTV